MKEDEKNVLTQIEIDNIIDKSINISIISKLFNLKIIDENQFIVLKDKLGTFY